MGNTSENMSHAAESCPACREPLHEGLHPWHKICQVCTYEGSTLLVDIDVDGHREVLDEVLREEGLSDLRQLNFQMLASDLSKSVRSGEEGRPRLLDVGCAHGWFLEATSDAFTVLGIEPDVRVADAAIARGLPVRKGFFPDVLAPDEFFDVIIFNDVLEHIPDISSAMHACRRHLAPGGRVVINAPARTGMFYRVSKIMSQLGLPASFERMWQKGFPSPHVHYLDDDSVRAIGERSALQLIQKRTLPSLSTKGLYARIRYDRSVSTAKAVAMTAVLTMISPLLRLLPADIKVWVLSPKA